MGDPRTVPKMLDTTCPQSYLQSDFIAQLQHAVRTQLLGLMDKLPAQGLERLGKGAFRDLLEDLQGPRGTLLLLHQELAELEADPGRWGLDLLDIAVHQHDGVVPPLVLDQPLDQLEPFRRGRPPAGD